MTSWVRLWHDMPTDPKFRTIARAAKQPLPVVVSVFTFMLADASANENERGRTTATDEDIASAFDIEESDVAAIRQAMQGRVLDGNYLAGWEKRQPKKEDNSAGRAKAWRAQKQAEAEAERSRTTANASERPDTEADTDKNQNRKKDPPVAPQGGGAGALFDEIVSLFPRSPHFNEAKAEKLFSFLSQADQAACATKARSFAAWWTAEQARRKRSVAEALPFAPPLDKWLKEGSWRSFEAAAMAPTVELPVLRQDDPLIPAIERIRGRKIMFGTKGTTTVTPAELEQARRDMGGSAAA